MIVKNDKKTINGWVMYDWANSVYALVITTAIFPSYFYNQTGGGKDNKAALVDDKLVRAGDILPDGRKVLSVTDSGVELQQQ